MPKTKIRGRWSASLPAFHAKTKRKNGGGRGPDGAQSRSGSDCPAVTSGGTVCLYSVLSANVVDYAAGRTSFQGAVEQRAHHRFAAVQVT